MIISIQEARELLNEFERSGGKYVLIADDYGKARKVDVDSGRNVIEAAIKPLWYDENDFLRYILAECARKKSTVIF